jgi:hypothetical protein
MDIERVKQHLAVADRHVAEGRERINRQTAIIDQLEHRGHRFGQTASRSFGRYFPKAPNAPGGDCSGA